MSKIVIMAILAIHMSIAVTQAQSNTPNPSNNPSVSSVPELERRARVLDEKAEFWTRFSLCFVGLTAVAAMLYFIGQRAQGVRTKQAAQAHAEVSAQKDRENAALIERVRAEAATESKRIETEAAGKIAQAKSDADIAIAGAKADAAKANEEAGKANKRAGELENAAASLTAKNLETEGRLEAEKRNLLEMEKSLRWRSIIEHVDSRTHASDIDPLRAFKGTQAIIEFLPEPEAIRAARQLSGILKEAGWDVPKAKPNPDLNEEFFDGAVLHLPIIKTTSSREEEAFVDKAKHAADSLIAFLTSNGWQGVRTTPDEKMEFNTIKISIGMLPRPYFLPEEIKKARQRFDREIEERKRRIQQQIEEIEHPRQKPPQ